MTTEQITQLILALPVGERVEIAQALWESLGDARPATDSQNDDAVGIAEQRDAELVSGQVVGRTHEEIIVAARRMLKCD